MRGTCNSGIGFEVKSFRQGLASHRAQEASLVAPRAVRGDAGSGVHLPVSLEIRTNARRDLKLGVQLDRFQIDLKL